MNLQFNAQMSTIYIALLAQIKKLCNEWIAKNNKMVEN